MFTAQIFDPYRTSRDGWAVTREGDERHFLTGLTEAEATYGCMIANADALPYDNDPDNREWLLDQVTPTFCVVCETVKFTGEVDTSGRCRACQP